MCHFITPGGRLGCWHRLHVLLFIRSWDCAELGLKGGLRLVTQGCGTSALRTGMHMQVLGLPPEVVRESPLRDNLRLQVREGSSRTCAAESCSQSQCWTSRSRVCSTAHI